MTTNAITIIFKYDMSRTLRRGMGRFALGLDPKRPHMTPYKGTQMWNYFRIFSEIIITGMIIFGYDMTFGVPTKGAQKDQQDISQKIIFDWPKLYLLN